MMTANPLDVVPATEARSVWNAAVRPVVAAGLGFRPGKSTMRGWVREAHPLAFTFHFQVTKYGFDRYSGGRFITQFNASDRSRATAVLYRMWSLLGDQRRVEFFQLNCAAVSRLPGPSDAIVRALPESLRETYMADFRVPADIPPPTADVWCRYATREDVVHWGAFIAANLEEMVARCEQLLFQLEDGTQSIGGVVVNSPAKLV
jgi:hypothetical protein